MAEPPAIGTPHSVDADADRPMRRAADGRTTAKLVVVASFGRALGVDYASFVAREEARDHVVIAQSEPRGLAGSPVRAIPVAELASFIEASARSQPLDLSFVLFVRPRLTEQASSELDKILALAERSGARFLAVVSTFRVHLDDARAQACEQNIVERLKGFSGRVALFRAGHVLSPSAATSRWFARLAPFYALVPGNVQSCFLEGPELFEAIEAVRLGEGEPSRDSLHRLDPDAPSMSIAGRRVSARIRPYTLLGPNLSVREVLKRHGNGSVVDSILGAVGRVLSWLMIGHIALLAMTLLSRRYPSLRSWNVHTIRPDSLRELVALCHRFNRQYVRVVGYNNGVVHFGHRYPGRTVVSTVRCNRLRSAGLTELKADCGATVRGALDYLARDNRDLYVVPNYSYVSLGTAFFVPIHGSAVDYSTVADTISRVLLYDPRSDRVIAASRGDNAFRDHVYDQQTDVILLRMYLVVKPKSGYFVRRETLICPTASDLLAALRDSSCENVEIRQGGAASDKVTVARYYKEAGDSSSPAMALPRDALGRLWDRLEENPISSFLMHALSRHVAWHTELFFTPSEFETFWKTHSEVPLRKIQLRYLKRDGLPHSPCRDDDCVSSDMFVLRWDRMRLFAYLTRRFTIVRANPGKHSR